MPSLRLAIILIVGLPTSLAAQCQLCSRVPPVAAVTPNPLPKPLDITIEASLDFSRVAQAGSQGGSVSIDPTTGARSISGGLRDLGGGVLRGQVRVQGEPMRPIRVILPSRISLTAADGSSVDVIDIRTNLPPNPALGSDGVLSFDFGGQLNVRAANAGNYRGRIPITVEYQ